jgi:broad specificity phosphatase PhoE
MERTRRPWVSLMRTNVTRLYLVRHGHTLWDDEQRLKGQVDVPLSSLGEAQSVAIGEYFRDAQIAAVYASTLYRTQRTATLLGVGCHVRASPLLDERSFGLWQGMKPAEVRRERAGREPNWSAAAPLGETLEAFAARTRLFMESVAVGWAGCNVIAVTHEGVIKNALLPAIGAPVANRSAFSAPTGTISLLQHDGTAWRPVFLASDPARAARDYPAPAAREEGS